MWNDHFEGPNFLTLKGSDRDWMRKTHHILQMLNGHFEGKYFLTSKLSNCDGMIRIMHVLNGNVGVDIILPSKNQSAELSNKLGLNVANVE